VNIKNIKNAIELPNWSAEVEDGKLEDLWITFKIGEEKINVCALYVSTTPKRCNANTYCKVEDFKIFLDKLKENNNKRPNDTFFIIGDFNFNDYFKYQDKKKLRGKKGTKLDLMIEAFEDHCKMTQYNLVLNSKKTMLDYVFSNQKIGIVERCPKEICFRDERPEQHKALRFVYPMKKQNDMETMEVEEILNACNSRQDSKEEFLGEIQNDLQKQIIDLTNEFQDFKISINEVLQELKMEMSKGFKHINEKLEVLQTQISYQ
jgi:hypothetical protein